MMCLRRIVRLIDYFALSIGPRPSADFNLLKRDISPGLILGQERPAGYDMTGDPTTMHSDRPSLDEIVRALREIMPDLAERYSVKHLGVFGSYVRGRSG
jgi:hypothetical protein